ncbi:hypothetical protein V6N13_092686 [Hibiscus sabdariffa]
MHSGSGIHLLMTPTALPPPNKYTIFGSSAPFLIVAVMNPVKFHLRILLVFFLSHCSFSADTITRDHFIQDNNDEVMVSGGKTFALGFFSPGSSTNRYVGIWYHQIPEKTIVWVANRDKPIKDKSGILSIDTRGNLALFQRNQTLPVWSTNMSTTGTGDSSIATILDSGNLVLLQNDARRTVLWQSFDHPTNTWLSLQSLGLNVRTGLNLVFTSWKSPDDPGVGEYSFEMNPAGFPQIFLYKGSAPLWRSGTWTGHSWSGIPEMTKNILFNDSFVYTDDELTFSSNVRNASFISRTVTNETGILQRLTWNNEEQSWIVFSSTQKESCDFYGYCGPNGYCNPDLSGRFECTCFPGFEPKSPEAWTIRDATGGCLRKRGISLCGNGEGFAKFKHVKVPDTSAAHVDMTMGLKQCKDKCLRNCTCMAYASAYSEIGRGTGCLTWHGDLLDARAYTNTGQDLYIRVDKNELARYRKKSLLQKKGMLAFVIVSSAVVFLILVAFFYCLVRRRRSAARTRNSKHMFSFTTFEGSLGEKEIDESRRNGDLPFFHLSTIAVATNNFSSDNKLGQGGFGPVYKGVLLNGKEIAVKRLSKHSGQGVQEFKNEIVLIAKLQHRNLVRMLGCCVEGEEKMLIYEFLPNRSLDSIIFDESKRSLLDWKKHFGLARIFGGDETEGDTKRVVGTYGYMSPEYAMHGHFSMKSDVYSFGVLLLEIITGKKNSCYFPDSPSLNLVGHVWELWKEGKAIVVADSELENKAHKRDETSSSEGTNSVNGASVTTIQAR